ncbi:MAG: RsmE family RNA methyltransferase [Verrucomicrobiota bacterium]|jgi:16S rRNA (uracil1498-N3)-methyltransferase|nr:RsmE family RNA methyltransferase [Verrucomicrobiota bacterium]MDP7047855.1 RsmE family RNA methyltransferase [Verrucomicrobiota bacterium]
MHRFFIPPKDSHNNPLRLSPQESKHARSVLRLRESDRVVVLNGAGKELLCQVNEVRSEAVSLKLVQENKITPLPFEITLYQAVTKGKAMDFIVQKAAELGAHRIVPVLSDRSVPAWDDAKAAAKIEKWRGISIESIKQCGSAWLPRLELPMSPKAALVDARQSHLSLIATLQPDAKHPREQIDAYAAEYGQAPRKLAIWVGPEGDYTPAEINTIRTGAQPITLGPLVLRSETAAIYCLAVLNYELQARP